MREKICIIGIGKLGLCFALNLEKKGYEVIGIDVSQNYVDSLAAKTFVSDEPNVTEMLQEAVHFHPTTDFSRAFESKVIFVLVATPSLPDGKYDHSQIHDVLSHLLAFGELTSNISINRTDLIIGCTTMPGYCEYAQQRLNSFMRTRGNDCGFFISYNPEFIAQGTIIRDQLNPDMILIGEADEAIGNKLQEIYTKLVDNSPKFSRMSPTEAEIAKIALNCFLTTKISFANMVGDVVLSSGGRPDVVLSAIGQDSRIGGKYLKYGFGFGGPCFPRDNRAFGIHADKVGVKPLIPVATDESNSLHLDYQAKNYSEEKSVTFDYVTYKPESTMLTESQQLALAVKLADNGWNVTINEREKVIEEVKKIHGNKFTYTVRNS